MSRRARDTQFGFKGNTQQKSSTPSAPYTTTSLQDLHLVMQEKLTLRNFLIASALTATGASLFYLSQQPVGQRAKAKASENVTAAYHATTGMLMQLINCSKYYTKHLTKSPMEALKLAQKKQGELTKEIDAFNTVKAASNDLNNIHTTMLQNRINARNEIELLIAAFKAKLQANTHFTDSDTELFTKKVNEALVFPDPIVEKTESNTASSLAMPNAKPSSLPGTPQNTPIVPSTPTEQPSIDAQTSNDNKKVGQKASVELLVLNETSAVFKNDTPDDKSSLSNTSSSDDESFHSDDENTVRISQKVVDRKKSDPALLKAEENSHSYLSGQTDQNPGVLHRVSSSVSAATTSLFGMFRGTNTQNTQPQAQNNQQRTQSVAAYN